ncbi:MAG: hypothetical protein F4W95_08040 [Chloroflexi bacterium]|nr:hypothetical protein [Chloroflexota bacterium]MYD48422.1 hypothetical protein [Chloroflexota bacterium]
MTSRRTTSARVCGEQDCGERTSRPNHPLCLTHYRAAQDGDIDECPNCLDVYKPSGYPICRQCYAKNQRQPDAQVRERRGDYADDSKGWNRPPEPAPVAVSPDATKAVELVRRNISRYGKECANHETNTVQYLVVPMLRGLGWDDADPTQVVKEYKPAGKRRYGSAIAVDIALMRRDSPWAFVEAKRLDREYDQDYMGQLSKYAAYLQDGGIAVLTNGRFWIVCEVANGRPLHRATIDIGDGDAKAVALKLNDALGVLGVENDVSRSSLRAVASRQSIPDPGAIIDDLKRYRETVAKRLRVPPFRVLNNDTISRVAKDLPEDIDQLRNVSGIGPATLERHGAPIIKIVRSHVSGYGQAPDPIADVDDLPF